MSKRSIPVYFLIDVSGGMIGEPIAAVNSELKKFVLSEDLDWCRDLIFISIITFGDDATQVMPLTSLRECKMPELEADGMRALGPALSLLCECRKRECPIESGLWYKPYVFVLTGGAQCCGDFQKGIFDFKSQHWGRYMFGRIGDDYYFQELRLINPELINPLRGKPPLEAVKCFFEMALFRTTDYAENCTEWAILHGDDETIEGEDAELHDLGNSTSFDETAICSEDIPLDRVYGENSISFSRSSPRLPVYLVVDVSQSMAGESIQDVNNGIQQLIADLRSDPWALDTVWLSAITFANDARQIVPLTDLESFQVPEFLVGGKTNLGNASPQIT